MSDAPAPSGRIAGSTRTVGVIGWPVDHSLSPAIHNAGFAALGLDWVYVPMPVPPGRVRAAIEGLRALGFAGANVTMPHKSAAAEVVEELSDDARLLGAVNTIVVGPEAISGHNTDVSGFDRFLRGDVGFDPQGRTALLFGAGGAARACALALARGGLARLTVATRDPKTTDGVRTSLEGSGTTVSVVRLAEAATETADLVVNATPLGSAGESLPLPALGPRAIGVDLLYRPSSTPLQTTVRSAGGRAFGGLGLLLHQAAIAFELWTGQPAPLAVMSAAALAELATEGAATPG